jgi:hypothetical protein
MATHPLTRELTIIAQDPSVRRRGRILTTRISVPAEALGAGPRGYRVHIVDYDASANRLYAPLPPKAMGSDTRPVDPYAALAGDTKLSPGAFNRRLLQDPRFHAQNVYAIVMRTLARFERALGRRISWSFGGHQLKIAPHAFADANAFYSPEDEGLFFGYFAGSPRASAVRTTDVVFTCLSHDIVVHETVHAVVDGLRPRLMEPSSPDQAAFHEAFADVVALLAVFSLPDVVREAIRRVAGADRRTLSVAHLTVRALQQGVLFGLGEQFGDALSGVHGSSLRRSVQIRPNPALIHSKRYQEEHDRGELLVAAMLRAFLKVFRARLETLGRDQRGQLPATRIAEEGADIAGRLMTLSIRALDYLPPTDVEFGDFLSAMITSDREIHPDDSRYHMRDALRAGFSDFGIRPASTRGAKDNYGAWRAPEADLSYAGVHRDALQRDPDEVFRFIWENRTELGLCESAYTEVMSVRPCLRVDEDGFTLRETVADYVQILTVRARELESIPIPAPRRGRIRRPRGVSPGRNVRLLGGGALVFDEYGRLKYHIRNSLLNPQKQTRRLRHLAEAGFFDTGRRARGFAALHMKAMRPELPSSRREVEQWR